MNKECKKHGVVSHALRTEGGFRCRKCAVEAVERRRRKIKRDALEFLGGKCQRCGYDRCGAALEFHHRDPKGKDFEITKSMSWDKILVELKKCDLLCSNCHREEHNAEKRVV